MKNRRSIADILVIGITFILFIMALFVKGFTKELLIEAGVLLVSIKLILMNHKASNSRKRLLDELTTIKETLKTIENRQNNS